MIKTIIYTTALTILGLSLQAQIKVYSGGKVAVGSTGYTPNALLDICPSSSQGSTRIAESTLTHYWNGEANPRWGIGRDLLSSGQAAIAFGGGGSGALDTYLGRDGSGNMIFKTNNLERMRITYGGGIQFTSWTNVMLDWSGGSGSPCLYPSSSWYLQLGKSNAFLGDCYITHELYMVAPTYYSDKNVKNNINYKLDRTLAKLQKLKPVSYNLKPELFKGFPAKKIEEYSGKKQYGFIAQELQEVFPELVDKDSTTGHLGIQYTNLIAVLVDAVNLQQAQLDSLKQALSICCNAKGTGNRTIKQDTTNNGNGQRTLNNNQLTANGDQITSAKLYQNNPNPFSQTTVVKCFIPQSNQNASLLVFDLNGSLKKTIAISSKGDVNTTINGRELVSGMYYYTLLIDGVEIDTKKMILTA